MAVLTSEIKLYRAAESSDLDSNGGRLSSNLVPSGVQNGIFPDVTQAQRVAGHVTYRKAFAKVENPNEEVLQNAFVFLDNTTPGQDMMTVFAGTATDVQSDSTADGESDSERHYGVGQLSSTVNSGVTSITVQVEDASSETIYEVGDIIRISDGSNETLRTLTSVSFSGNVATLGFTGGLATGYAASNTFVASGLPLGNIGATVTQANNASSSSGSVDITNFPITPDATGGVDDTWTVTFTSATAFSVSGAATGSVGAGTVAGAFSPNNPDFSAPYFSIPSGFWSGTFANSDSYTFSTASASAAFWYKRRVPAGSAANAANVQTTRISGETA